MEIKREDDEEEEMKVVVTEIAAKIKMVKMRGGDAATDNDGKGRWQR